MDENIKQIYESLKIFSKPDDIIGFESEVKENIREKNFLQ